MSDVPVIILVVLAFITGFVVGRTKATVCEVPKPASGYVAPPKSKYAEALDRMFKGENREGTNEIR